MFLLVMIYLSRSQNLYCSDQFCSNCLQGYSYRSTTCVSICPENSNQSLNGTCIILNASWIRDVQFFNYLEFNSSSVDVFHHPEGLPFSDQNKRSPIPTKERGFYFTKTSRLKTDSHWVLAPLFSIDFIIRISGDGTVLKVTYLQKSIIHFYSQNGKFIVEILLFRDLNEELKRFSMNFNSNQWFHPALRCLLDFDKTTISFKLIQYLNSFEFFTFPDLEYELGSENSSFTGFLYEIMFSNNENLQIYFNFQPPSCDFNEFYDSISDTCQGCSSLCDVWPWCVRSTSCSLCYTEVCLSCSGFTFSDCKNCSSLLQAPFCDSAPKCLSGQIFSCNVCESEFVLISGLCLFSPFNYQEGSTSPSIQIKFNNFQRFYENFQSGSNSESYSPFNNPEHDDPFPYYNRGMYFSKTSFLISKEPMSLGCTFSFAVWLFVVSKTISPIFSSDYLQILDSNEVKIKMSNYQESKTFISRHYFDSKQWQLFTVVVSFSSSTTTIHVGKYENSTFIDTFSPDYFFQDTPNFYKIGGGPDPTLKFEGFIYSFRIWNFGINDWLNYIDDCRDTHPGCRWISKSYRYWNNYENQVMDCDLECLDGCKTWGTCNQCEDIRCSFCIGYELPCEIESDPDCNPNFHYTSEKCCHLNCKDCYGPGFFRCFSCISGYSHLGNFCQKECPSFSNNIEGECLLPDNQIIDLNLEAISKNTVDTKNSVIFTSGFDTSSSVWPHVDDADPIPTYSRGSYFKPQSFMKSQDLIFSHNFTMIFYMKLKKYGKLFTKGELMLSLNSSNSIFDFQGTTHELNPVSLDKWQVLLFRVYSDIDGYIIPSLLTLDFNGNINVVKYPVYFDDPASPLIIGDSRDSFEGFLWKLKIFFNKGDIDIPDINICSSLITSNCVQNCEIYELLAGDSCISCHQDCQFGCRSPENCELCVESSCISCENFKTCTYCKTNQYKKGSKCVCESGFFMSEESECEKCPHFFLEFLCLEICPLGFHPEMKKCSENFEDGRAVKFLFDQISNEVKDKVSNIWAVFEDIIGSSYSYGAFAAYQRGIFFSGNFSVLKLPKRSERVLMFGLQFFIGIWAKFQEDGEFLRKFGPGSSLIESYLSNFILNVKVQLSDGESLNLIEKINQSEWCHLMISLNFLGYTDFSIFINGHLSSIETSVSYFLDSRGDLMRFGSESGDSFNGFIYSLEIYVRPPQLDGLLGNNCKGCSFCPINEGCISPCNISFFQENNESMSVCVSCLENCTKGCRFSQNCSLCEDPNCIECESFNSKSCLQCEIGFEIVNNSCFKCEGKVFYNFSNKTCMKCLGVCDECLSETICTKCKSHSTLTNDSRCTCDKGYYEDLECKRMLFGVVAEVTNKNLVKLIFTEKLAYDLNTSFLEVKVNQKQIDFSLVKIDRYSFKISLDYKISMKKAKLLINFVKNIESQDNSLLNINSIEATLFDVTESTFSTSLLLIKKYTRLIFAISLGLMFVGSLMNFDPNCLYHFFNSVELFTYTLLYNLELDKEIAEFLKSAQISSNIPSLFDFLDLSSFQIKDVNLNSFGLETYIIFGSSRVIISLLIFIVFIHLLALLLRLFMKSSERMGKFLSFFKFKAYLRFWLQTFLELFLGSLLGFKYLGYERRVEKINLAICSFIIFLHFSCLCLLMYCVYKRPGLNEKDLKTFMLKFSEFFEEFKERGRSDWLFYVVFVVRRFFLVLMIVAGFHGILQLAVSIVFSISVVFIQILIYICSTQCFKSRAFLYYNCYLEVSTISYYLLLSVSISASNESKKSLTYSAIFLIISVIFLSLCYSFVPSVQKICFHCKRSKIFIKVSPADEKNETGLKRQNLNILNPQNVTRSHQRSSADDELNAIQNSLQEI